MRRVAVASAVDGDSELARQLIESARKLGCARPVASRSCRANRAFVGMAQVLNVSVSRQAEQLEDQLCRHRRTYRQPNAGRLLENKSSARLPTEDSTRRSTAIERVVCGRCTGQRIRARPEHQVGDAIVRDAGCWVAEEHVVRDSLPKNGRLPSPMTTGTRSTDVEHHVLRA